MNHSIFRSPRLNQILRAGFVLALLSLVLLPSLHAQAPAGRPAGKISALIPQDFITRGTQRLEAAKDMPVVWNDVIETGRGGRVRVNLLDGSILNIGSQAKMKIVQHNEVSQQTSLELSYGKARASVVKLTQPDSKFEVKTQQAVCGVVGTDEYLDSNPNSTRVISLFGIIVVGSSDPSIPGTQTLNTGEVTDVGTGQSPSPKRHATDEELYQAIQDTATGAQGQISTPSGFPGQTLDAVLVGQNLLPVTGVSISGDGVTLALGTGATSTTVPVTITIASTAPPGTRQITLQTPRGDVSTAFIVRAPGEVVLNAVITGQWWYRPDAPPEDVTPPNLSLAQGARVLLDGSGSTGAVSSYAWEIQGGRSGGNQVTFDIDTSQLSPGTHRVILRVSGTGRASAQAELALIVRGLPNPDDVLQGLRTAYETLQVNQFMSFFDSEQFRGYPALEENMRNALQELSNMRVYLRIDNRQLQGDDAIYQATFETSFNTKADPGRIQNRNEILTLRLHLQRERDREIWRIVDYSSVTSPLSSALIGVGMGTGSVIFGVGANSGVPDFTLAINPPTLILPSSALRVDVGSQLNFQDNVQISVEGLPGGVSATSTTLHPRGTGDVVSGTIEITTSANAVPQTAAARVVGRSGPLEHSATLTLQITSFQISLASSSIEVPVGSSSSVGVTVTGQNGFSQPVNVVVGNLPPGVTVNSLSLTGGTGSLTFNAGSNVTPQRATVNVVATDATGQIRRVASLELRLTSFRLNISPPSSLASPVDLVIGSTASFTVSVVPADPTLGFSGTVSLAVQPPDGISSSLTSATLTAGQSQTFTFSPTGTSIGIREIPIRATFGSFSTSVSAFVNVHGSFDLVSIPATSSGSPAVLTQGGTTSIQVMVIGRDRFNGTVDLSLGLLRGGISADPTSATVAAGNSITFVFSAALTAPTGLVQLTVRGRVGAIEKTLAIFLNVLPAPSFNLVVNPATSLASPLNLIVGDSASFSVSLEPLNGFNGTVNLSTDAVPGISIDPLSAMLSVGSSAGFRVQVSSQVNPGIVQVTIHGRSGTLDRTASLFLNIQSFRLVITPVTSSSSPIRLNLGGQTSFTVQLQGLNGFTGSAAITVDVPGGLDASVPPASLNAGSSFELVVTALAGPGLEQIAVHAQRGTFQTTTFAFVDIVAPARPPQSALFVSGPGESPDNPLFICQGSPFASTASIDARGTSPLFVSCSTSLPTGVFVSFPSCPALVVPGGVSADIAVTATNAAALGPASFTLRAFSTSGPVQSVTVFLHIESCEFIRAARRDTLAGKTSTNLGGGTSIAGETTKIPSAVNTEARSSVPTILGIEPDRAVAGARIQVVIAGRSLATARAVRASAEDISAALAGPAEDHRLVVTLRLSQQATPGTYLLSVDGAAGSASAPFTVLPRPAAARGAESREAVAHGSDDLREGTRARASENAEIAPTAIPTGPVDLPDLVVSRDEIGVSPAMPHAGETVTFRVPVHNEGGATAHNVVVEFSIPEANLRARETITLGPGRSTTLLFEWPAARATNGRGIEARVVIDPENRLTEASKQNNVATLPRLVIDGGSEASRPVAGLPSPTQAASRSALLRRADRTGVDLALGECVALHLSSGATSTCGSSGDLELRLSGDGTTLAFAADGIRPLAAEALEQVTSVEQGVGARELAVEVGRVYAVNSRSRVAAVRVRSLRGLEQARAERAARPPAALDSPRMASGLEGKLADLGSRAQFGRRVRVELEWVVLPKTH